MTTTDRNDLAPEGECRSCDEIRSGRDRHGPRHTASPYCQSGKRPHCTCDACY